MEETNEQQKEGLVQEHNLFTSKNIDKIAEAMAKFQGACPEITLDAEVEVTMKSGGKYKFKYATLSNINKLIKKPLSENGLAVTQVTSNTAGEITTLLMHSSGQWIRSVIKMQSSNNPQDMGSAITYGRRYSLSAILGISANTDDDGNLAHGNSVQNKAKANTPAKKNTPKKEEPKKKTELTPGCDKWSTAIEKVKGGMKIEEIRKGYDITDENFAKLKKEAMI